jgi:high-affinity K+ transport system ATPase subunit B
VLSDWVKVKITSNPGETFLDRMIALVEGAERQKTPNEIALNILLAGLTIVFLLAVVTLQPFAIYAGAPQTVFVLVSLLVCLIPTTIGGLLSAIGIAGMDRLVQHNVLAMSGRAVEAAGDVNTLLLDKTGTITLGNRQATEFVTAPGVTEAMLADSAQLSSLADETPEGRSIVVLAKEKYGLRRVYSVQRDHSHVGREYGRTRHPQRRDGCGCQISGRARRCASRRSACRGGGHCALRRDTAGGGGEWPGTGSDSLEGYRKGRHAAAFRSTARHGNHDGDDYGG